MSGIRKQNTVTKVVGLRRISSCVAEVVGSFSIFASLNERALSSVGSEHLPYKEGVVGSNPTEPTIRTQESIYIY